MTIKHDSEPLPAVIHSGFRGDYYWQILSPAGWPRHYFVSILSLTRFGTRYPLSDLLSIGVVKRSGKPEGFFAAGPMPLGFPIVLVPGTQIDRDRQVSAQRSNDEDRDEETEAPDSSWLGRYIDDVAPIVLRDARIPEPDEPLLRSLCSLSVASADDDREERPDRYAYIKLHSLLSCTREDDLNGLRAVAAIAKRIRTTTRNRLATDANTGTERVIVWVLVERNGEHLVVKADPLDREGPDLFGRIARFGEALYPTRVYDFLRDHIRAAPCPEKAAQPPVEAMALG